MIKNREEFQDGLRSLNLGKDSAALAVTEETPAAEPVEGEAKPLQVAGIGRSFLKGLFGKEMGEAVGRSSADIVKNVPKKPVTPKVDLKEMESVIGKYAATKADTPLSSAKPTPSQVLNESNNVSDIERLVNEVANIDIQNSPR
ncbi:MAG: hypothetical protein PF495_14485, partial [Spirochaetales bacterium]|nr:hypothetical protein [Spirochaetales bacterium]